MIFFPMKQPYHYQNSLVPNEAFNRYPKRTVEHSYTTNLVGHVVWINIIIVTVIILPSSLQTNIGNFSLMPVANS
jgi:hypothetical protein